MVGVVARHHSRVVAVLLMVCGLMVVAAPAASAHAVLQFSSPTAGSLLSSGARIDRVELRFDEPVDAAPGAVQVIAADGGRVDTGIVEHPEGDGARVAVRVEDDLLPGSYLVVWRVISADSHPVHGSFTFALGRSGSVAQAAADPPADGIGLALGINRFISYAAVLLLVGVTSFFLFCWPAGWPAASRSRLLRGALLAAAAADVIGVSLQAAFDAGRGWTGAVDAGGVADLLFTRFGVAHIIRLMLLVAIWVATNRLSPDRRETRLLTAAGIAAVLVTVAAEGHSGGSPLLIGVDVAHLAAAGAWFGGLTVLTMEWLAARRNNRTAGEPQDPHVTAAATVAVMERTVAQPAPPLLAVRRFSTLAMSSVAVLAISGVVQAIHQVEQWGALIDTTYGRLLIVKIGGVMLTLAVAAVSRTIVHRKSAIADDKRADRLGRTVAVETLLLAVVVAVTSALVATPPARVDYRPVQDITTMAGPVTVQVTAVPLAPMTMSVHLYTFGTNGLPTDVINVQAEATASGGPPKAVTVPLLPAGTGHFIADDVLLPQLGSWTLKLTVRASTVDIYSTTVPLTVR